MATLKPVFYFTLLVFLWFACENRPHRKKPSPNIAQETYAQVIGIVDGDTFDMLVEKSTIRVRLSAIDCPEKGQPFGKAAKNYLSELCFGKKVRWEEQSKDRNKRSVCYVYLEDGRCVNHEMVRAGYAWNHVKYSKDPLLPVLEEEARNQKLGLWVDQEPIPPWAWRKKGKE